MYCTGCGKKMDDNDLFCGSCGTPRFNNQVVATPTVTATNLTENSNDPIMFGIISFLAPLVGIILSIAVSKDKPKASKVGLIVGIIRLLFNIVIFALYFILMVTFNY